MGGDAREPRPNRLAVPALTVRGSQYLGMVTAALFIFARGQIKREQDRADRLEAQLTQMHAATADKVIPALVAATQTVEDVQQLLRDLSRDRGQR